METYQQEMKELLGKHGASLVGFADMRMYIDRIPDSMPFAVSIARALDPKIVAGIKSGPTLHYQDEYNRLNAALNELAECAAIFLRERGFVALIMSSTIGRIDDEFKKTLRMPLPHKTVATRSGIGWIGKDALVVTKEYGSAIRFASVLTNAPFKTGKPMNDSLCGGCTSCVDMCPANAPSGKNWHVGLDRDDFFDVKACFCQTERMKRENGLQSNICGICIAACPWTQNYIARKTYNQNNA